MDGTIRLRSVAWFVTGGVIAAAVALVFVNAWRVDAAPGDSDSTLVPIAPCRLADTRPAPDRVGPNASLGVDDTTTITAHGTNGECTIPAEAVGLSLNVTALLASEPTFLTIWPGGDRPLASSLNPAPGQPPTPNAVVTQLSDAGRFDVYNLAGSVDVIIDVNGYYTDESLIELAEDVAALQTLAEALDDNVARLRSGTDTIPSGVTATGYGQTQFTPALITLPVRAAGVTDLKFAPEPPGQDAVDDTFEDSACDTPANDPAPTPGVLCFFVLSASNVEDIMLVQTGLETFDEFDQIFLTGTATGAPGTPRELLYFWAYTAP